MNRPDALRGGAYVRMLPGGRRAGLGRQGVGLKYATTEVRMAPVRALDMREGETYE